MSTSSENSSVNLKVAEWIKPNIPESSVANADYIEVPVEINNTITKVECFINSTQEDDLHLGAHFLQFHGYQFSFNGISLDSSKAPIALHMNEISFAYNLPDHQHLKQYLQNQAFFMKKDRNLRQSVTDNNNNRVVIVKRTKQ
ncbi:hypothetical protein ACFFRR_003510 [Megaselia abdita]